jgi:hypothetical protein
MIAEEILDDFDGLNADIIELIRIANHFDDDQIVAKNESYRSLKV